MNMRVSSFGLVATIALAALLACACGSPPVGNDDYDQLDAAAVGESSAWLSWHPPNARADAAPIAEPISYRIYLAKRSRFDDQGPRTYDDVVEAYPDTCGGEVPTCTATVGDLSPGTYYFAATAVMAGLESEFSNEASKTIVDNSRSTAVVDDRPSVSELAARDSETTMSAPVAGMRPNPPTELRVE